VGRTSEKSRDVILSAAEQFTKQRGAAAITVEGIAKAAGCAKGLVHYHFKTKTGLVRSVAERLTSYRESCWQEAFEAPGPQEAIDRTWTVLTEESTDGTLRAWSSLMFSKSILTDEAVKEMNERFGLLVRDSALRMLQASGLVPTVPDEEIGWYLGSVIHGMGFHLLSGRTVQELEGAYAAAWAGLLSLTRPGRASVGAGGGRAEPEAPVVH
jgi:AcrR family transcriptional regulator